MNTEDLLRARLHEIDTLQPPEPDDFEFRALETGQQRIGRRRSWTRGLLGAAAALAIGVLAFPIVGRSPYGSSSSGAAAGAGSTVGSAQVLGGEAQSAAGQAPPAPAPTSPASGPTSLPPTGTAAYDFDSTEGAAAIQRLSATLSQPPYSAHFTSLSVDDSTYPYRLVVHMPDVDPGVMAAVAAAFPPGAPILYARAPYSSASCQTTLARVEADRPTLARQGFAVGGTSCDVDGRVRLQLTAPPTPKQTSELSARYGDTVAATVSVAIP